MRHNLEVSLSPAINSLSRLIALKHDLTASYPIQLPAGSDHYFKKINKRQQLAIKYLLGN